jgi:Rps23 Pro-64 3,4-dihydroxylase Tpa1-like proline 4-hydroxylase
MEINETHAHLLEYIHIVDGVLPPETLESFLKICNNYPDFQSGKILGNNNSVDEKIRKTKIWYLKSIQEKSLTTVHWANFLQFIFNQLIKEYRNVKNLDNFNVGINDIQVLKYQKTSHYKFHVDDARTINRCLSVIFFVNDDYEGGELAFKFPNKEKEFTVEKKKNRAILWPSNFLYPHCVKPVISGTRFSVVAWAV